VTSKPLNSLIKEDMFLCDFGVSALLPTTQSKRTTFIGIPYWMAPEVITSGSLYDAKADVWSLGNTLYEMVTGSPPHSNQVEMQVLALIPSTNHRDLRKTREVRTCETFWRPVSRRSQEKYVYINVLLYLILIETPACHGRRVEQGQMDQNRTQNTDLYPQRAHVTI
jgi:serine/threonine protein kinase